MHLLERVSPFTAFHLIYATTMVVCMTVALSAFLLSKRLWRAMNTGQIDSRKRAELISCGVMLWVACAAILMIFGSYMAEQLKVVG